MLGLNCDCIYCVEARWLKGRKPSGVRRMMIILLRHHLIEKAKGVTV